jgi:GR25 family glycosyltransferase involved in LPS biosynthesis
MNNPFNFFDKIYCINLAERSDRWNECLKNFEKYEINNYERIDAVKIDANRPSKRKGQIGCALSFATCFEKMKKENLKNVLLFEDDFEFKYDKEILFEKLNNSLKDLPEDWDSLFLGGTVVNNYGFFPIEKYSDNLFKLNSAHCLHATAFSRKGILKIFDSFDNKIDWHKELINNYENMDVFMAKTYQHKTKSFLTSDLLCYQRISVSNIESAIYDYSEWMDRNFNYFKSLL